MDEPGAYAVRVERSGTGWAVSILDPAGRPVYRRACRSEGEARTFASTVRQHIAWLSPRRFREYYRLPEPDGDC